MKSKYFVIFVTCFMSGFGDFRILIAQTREDILWNLKKEFHDIKQDIDQMTNTPKEDLGRHEKGRLRLEEARINFEKERYLQTIYDVDVYLKNGSEYPKSELLQAYRMKALSFEKLDLLENARSAHLDFVRSFEKSSAYDELHDSLSKLIKWAPKTAHQENANLKRLLVLVATKKLPEPIEDDLEMTGYRKFWEEKDKKSPKIFPEEIESDFKTQRDQSLRARYHYWQAIEHIKDLKFEEAKEDLKLCIEKTPEHLLTLKAYAYLVLARIYVKQNFYDAALNAYGNIPKSALIYDDSFLEKVEYVLSQEKNPSVLINEFLSEKPESSFSPKFTRLLPFLSLLYDDQAAASDLLKTQKQTLEELQARIKSLRTQNLTYENVVELSKNRFLAPPWIISEIMGAHSQWTELFKHQRWVERGLDASASVLSRFDRDQSSPRFAIDRKRAISLFHKLISLEHRLTVFLSSDLGQEVHEKQELELLLTRKKALLENYVKILSHKSQWNEMGKVVRLTQEFDSLVAKLHDMKATNRGNKYSNSSQNLKIENVSTAEIEENLTGLSLKIKETLVDPHFYSATAFFYQKIFRRYTNLAFEEESIFQKYLQRRSHHADRMLRSDFAMLWKEFGESTEKLDLYFSIHAQSLESEIAKFKLDIRFHKDELVETKNKITLLKKSLDSVLKRSQKTILAHYDHELQELLAKNQEWQAEVHLLKYKALKKESRSLTQMQFLESELADLKTGVLWKWPKI